MTGTFSFLDRNMSAVDDLAEQLEATSIAGPLSVPFNPSATLRWKNFELSPVPRFLFRVYTPRSDCSTDEECTKSRDAANNLRSARRDIFQTTDCAATAKRIDDHLRWRCCERQDNLTSWTSSLLFALHYIFYRNSSPNDGLPMTDIRICVVDASRFGRQVFIRDMDLMTAFSLYSQSLARFRTLRGANSYYLGEYMSQGSLKIAGKCQCVSAQNLIDRGLFSLRAEFLDACGNASYGWAKPVVIARMSLDQEQQQNVELEQLEAAIHIGHMFGRGWRLPIAVSLVALLSGRLDFSVIQTIFRGERGFKGT